MGVDQPFFGAPNVTLANPVKREAVLSPMPLSVGDKCLTRLFMSGCFHHWELIPELGQKCYAAGCTLEEVRGCVRHLIVVAGYGPCLAATNHLHAAKLLDGNTPGKVGGPPGNAFDLVYTVVADAVREKMHNVDPVLTEYIRRHLYGDIYSSPGLSLAQKQILMVAFLGEANMHEQLFGHLLAAMRFGNDLDSCLKAIQIGFELSPCPSDAVYQGAVKTLEMAYRKYKKDFKEGPPEVPTLAVPDPNTVLIPPLYKPVEQLQEGIAAETLQEEAGNAVVAIVNPETEKQPMLQRAGPSEAFSKLQIERSGPSGNFSKLYNLKVRAFAHDMSRSTADSANP